MDIVNRFKLKDFLYVVPSDRQVIIRKNKNYQFIASDYPKALIYGLILDTNVMFSNVVKVDIQNAALVVTVNF